MEDTRLTPRELLDKYRYTGKLTPKLHEAAVYLATCGVPPRNALRALGIADATIRLWQHNAETGEKGPKYKALLDALDTAEQQSLADVANNARRLTEKDGRVAIDYLSRRDKDHWRKTDTLEVQGQIDVGPILARIAAAQRQIADGSYVNGDWNLPDDSPTNEAEHLGESDQET